jgi:hypothetical protein
VWGAPPACEALCLLEDSYHGVLAHEAQDRRAP